MTCTNQPNHTSLQSARFSCYVLCCWPEPYLFWCCVAAECERDLSSCAQPSLQGDKPAKGPIPSMNRGCVQKEVAWTLLPSSGPVERGRETESEKDGGERWRERERETVIERQATQH